MNLEQGLRATRLGAFVCRIAFLLCHPPGLQHDDIALRKFPHQPQLPVRQSSSILWDSGGVTYMFSAVLYPKAVLLYLGIGRFPLMFQGRNHLMPVEWCINVSI